MEKDIRVTIETKYSNYYTDNQLLGIVTKCCFNDGVYTTKRYKYLLSSVDAFGFATLERRPIVTWLRWDMEWKVIAVVKIVKE